jgi:hypothetical protein
VGVANPGPLEAGVKLEQAQAELDLLQQQFLDEAGMKPDRRKGFLCTRRIAARP